MFTGRSLAMRRSQSDPTGCLSVRAEHLPKPETRTSVERQTHFLLARPGPPGQSLRMGVCLAGRPGELHTHCARSERTVDHELAAASTKHRQSRGGRRCSLSLLLPDTWVTRTPGQALPLSRRLSCLAAPVLVARHFSSGPAATPERPDRARPPRRNEGDAGESVARADALSGGDRGLCEAPWPPLDGIAAQACPILSRDQQRFGRVGSVRAIGRARRGLSRSGRLPASAGYV